MYKKFEEKVNVYSGKNETQMVKYLNTRLIPTSYLFAEGYFSDLTFVKG